VNRGAYAIIREGMRGGFSHVFTHVLEIVAFKFFPYPSVPEFPLRVNNGQILQLDIITRQFMAVSHPRCTACQKKNQTKCHKILNCNFHIPSIFLLLPQTIDHSTANIFLISRKPLSAASSGGSSAMFNIFFVQPILYALPDLVNPQPIFHEALVPPMALSRFFSKSFTIAASLPHLLFSLIHARSFPYDRSVWSNLSTMGASAKG